ncbi:MAG: BON domain-containing protein [Gammaproteobacteria bacterium]|nr:BON domain-containing protein [Gammaproteobacteria bacterium]
MTSILTPRYRKHLVASTLAAVLAMPLAATAAQSTQDKSAATGMQDTQKTDDQARDWRMTRDTRLATDVLERLSGSSSLWGASITVSADDGDVTLDGSVTSEGQKERALRLARDVRGVQAVEDSLSIDEDAKQQFVRVDDEISARQAAKAVASAIGTGEVEAGWLYGYVVEGDEFQVDVVADAGRISLDGDIPSFANLQQVLKNVRAIEGVRSIETDVRVDEERMTYGRRTGPAGQYAAAGPYARAGAYRMAQPVVCECACPSAEFSRMEEESGDTKK